MSSTEASVTMRFQAAMTTRGSIVKGTYEISFLRRAVNSVLAHVLCYTDSYCTILVDTIEHTKYLPAMFTSGQQVIIVIILRQI